MVWTEAGARHIMFRNGHFTGATCVSDHSGPDELTELCFQRGSVRFDDKELWGRMRSTWGNHWKCEEEFDRRTVEKPKAARMRKSAEAHFSPLCRPESDFTSSFSSRCTNPLASPSTI
ncbi:hypothetical protein PG996_010065 [Apiospora saccharicola]|uniref:Uncharacterized protein n=1 Tax=Apiospora saccharicola TaxID=335842 RepID=A0ABR1UMI0_9PEZI